MGIEFTKEQYLGHLGARIVDGIVSDDLKWVFRPTSVHDLGVDGQIEILVGGRRASGKLIAVQVKCGDSFFKEQTAEGVVFREDRDHLDVWLESSLPVVLILCKPETRMAYWVEISHRTIELTAKAWKVIVPFTQQFGEHASDALVSLAQKPQPQELIRANLYRLIREKFPDMIVASVFAEPEDYYWFPYLGKTGDELVNITFHYVARGVMQVRDLEEIIRIAAINDKVCGAKRVKVFIISHHVDHTRLSEELKEAISHHPGVEVYRVVCSDSYWLEEVDESNEPIWFYPQHDYLTRVRLEYGHR